MKKFVTGLTASFLAVGTALAETGMTDNIESQLQGIEGHANTALQIAIGIAVVVIGWGYAKSLVKRGK